MIMESINNTSVALDDNDLINKAKSGYFVRSTDMERVYCPGGVLYKQYEDHTVHGHGYRYFNKEQCAACKYKNECYTKNNSNRRNYRVVYFGKSMEKKTDFDIITEDKTDNNETNKTENEVYRTEHAGIKIIKIPTNSLPYGYQNENGRMTINESEAKVVRELFALYKDGDDTGMSSKEIARLFEQKGYKTREGNHISASNVVRTWKKKDIYLGKAVKTYGVYEPILKDYNENDKPDVDVTDSDIIPPVKRKRGRPKSNWKIELEKFEQIRRAEDKIAKLTSQEEVSDLLLQTETGFPQDIINKYRVWRKNTKPKRSVEHTPALKVQLEEADYASLVNDDEKQLTYNDESMINVNIDEPQENSDQLSSDDLDISPFPLSSPVKRGRGRPKGSRNKTKRISSVKIDTAKPPVKNDSKKPNVLFEKPKIMGKIKLELEVEIGTDCEPQSTRKMLLWLLSVIDSQNSQQTDNRSDIDHD